MYPDSNFLWKFTMHLYYELVCFMFFITHKNFLPIVFSVQDMVRPLDKTNRMYYELERKNYRYTASLIGEGILIEKKHYYLYKLIAKKYGWPYIKETYDDLPETQTQHVIRLPQDPPRQSVVEQKLQNFYDKFKLRHIWWGFDLFIILMTLGLGMFGYRPQNESWFLNMFYMIVLLIFMQIFFIGPILIQKLALVVFRRGRRYLTS